ncbi:hypothetical protein [Natronorarus salvus]|uniref:hypothetical protein n=1 Tax=Natronorarus salvus TaxID=3117733 RepID=UPI002F25FB69
MSDDPAFDAPTRPERVLDDGGVEYAGRVVYTLSPEDGPVERWVEDVLDAERYTAGDWFDLPLPVYLVCDHEVGSLFRVVVAADSVQLQLLPDTDERALSAFFDRLRSESDVEWTVCCETD